MKTLEQIAEECAGKIVDIDREHGIDEAGIRFCVLTALKQAQDQSADTARLNALEALLVSSNVGNGVALAPYSIHKTGKKRIALQDLGDEDGSGLGENLVDAPSLRLALEALRSEEERKA